MSDWKICLIGSLCDIVKGETGLASAIPGKYPLVATGAERKSSNTYQFDTEAVCIPLVSSTGHGKKTLNYVHYQEGKFALGTILAAIIPKDKTILLASYLHRYLQFYKDRKIVPLMKGAANVSLAVKDIAKIEVPVPPIIKQKELVELFNKLYGFNDGFTHEAVAQSEYITKLRQAILQEAIEGKLTTYWRQANPVCKGDPEYDAEALLEKIKEEKKNRKGEKGNIRSEKELASIEAEDEPFALPDGWVWTRLGEIGVLARGKSKHRPRNEPSLFSDGVYPFVQTGEVSQSKYKQYKIQYTEKFYNKKGLAQSKIWPAGTLCITIAANIAETGFLSMAACFPDSVVGFISLSGLSTPRYVRYFLACAQSDLIKFAPATAQKNINLEILDNLIIPLPPLAEQRAIVEMVEKLLEMIDELETQIKEQRGHTEGLLQAVLGEAFRGD